MWDSSAGARPAAGRPPRARHAKIATDVVTTDGRTELVLKPDHAFLSDPATKYPVRVDPTVTLPANNDVDVNNVFNTAGNPADPTGPLLMAGTWDGNEKHRVHLRFDTASLTGTTVTDAKLSLLNMDSSGCGTTVAAGIQVRRLTSAWDENNLDWANKPTSTTEDAQINKAGFGDSCPGGPTALEWPVTGIAQDWAAGAANHGLVLQSPTETNVNNYRVLTSSEDTDFDNPPKLTITTTGPASTPAVSALTITPAQNSGGITTVTSLTPQLAATVSDTIGGTLTGQFEIEHDPTATGQGTGQIWTGASAAVTSGNQATATVPAGKLIDGWKVRWRARAANAAASTTSAWSAWQNATIDVPGPISEPAVGALQVNPSTVVNGTTVTSTLTPSLLAQVSDPAGGSLRAEYEIEHDPTATGQGTGQIWTGSVDNVASGTQASIAVPAGELIDGWVVRWRARAVAGQLSSAWSDWRQVKVDVIQPGEEPFAQTTGPVIRTDQSFTLATWLRWSDTDGDYTVIEQKGTHQAPFRLGNTPEHGLVFTLTSDDSADATQQGVLSNVKPPADEWFHLAGVYDASAKTASLYLNGALLKSEALSTASWQAETPMTIGTAIIGDLDDIQVFQKPMSADEVAGMHAGHSAKFSAPAVSTEPKRSNKKAESRPADLASSMQASTSFPYERLSTQQCADLREKKFPTPPGKSPNDNAINSSWSVYTYCTSSNHSWLVQGSRGSAGGVKLSTSLVIDAYAGGWKKHGEIARDDGKGAGARHPRDIAIYLRVDNVDYNSTWTAGHTGDEYIDVTIEAVSSPGNQGKCELTGSKWKTSSGEISKTVSQLARTWKNNEEESKEWWWTYRTSATKNATNLDGISYCAFRPYVTIHDDDAGGTPNSRSALDWVGLEAGTVPVWDRPVNIHATDSQALKDNAPSVRCDSSDSYQSHYAGCIFHRVSRIYMMHSTDPPGEKPMSQVANHLMMARDYPESTQPEETFDKPRKPITGKKFPGFWPREALHYMAPNALTDDDVLIRSRNKNMKDKVCRDQFAAEVAAGKECDEYPFASTREGAGQRKVDSDPKTQIWNFSIWPVIKVHNGAAGNHKQTFEMQYRLLNEDPFWVIVD
nr:DNRLRE domain-containing protein [Streptosporangium amethystogenes]